MDPTDVQMARLAAQVEAGFINVYRRFDDQAKELSDIKVEVRRTNGRVTALETKNAVRESDASGERGAITLSTLKWYGVILVSSVGGTIAFLKFLGKLLP